ncbi:hypothetical protein FKM82_028737 [Ascaphus truei]
MKTVLSLPDGGGPLFLPSPSLLPGCLLLPVAIRHSGKNPYCPSGSYIDWCVCPLTSPSDGGRTAICHPRDCTLRTCHCGGGP